MWALIKYLHFDPSYSLRNQTCYILYRLRMIPRILWYNWFHSIFQPRHVRFQRLNFILREKTFFEKFLILLFSSLSVTEVQLSSLAYQHFLFFLHQYLSHLSGRSGHLILELAFNQLMICLCDYTRNILGVFKWLWSKNLVILSLSRCLVQIVICCPKLHKFNKWLVQLFVLSIHGILLHFFFEVMLSDRSCIQDCINKELSPFKLLVYRDILINRRFW